MERERSFLNPIQRLVEVGEKVGEWIRYGERALKIAED